MKILFTVSTYKPHVDGIQFVTSYLAEGLAKKGHLIDLIAYEYKDLTDKKEEVINNVHIFRYPAKTVHMIHRGDKKAYQKLILENQKNYDVLINVGSQTAFTDWLLPIIDNVYIPKILHLHSIWDFKFHASDLVSLRTFASKALGNVRWGLYFIKNKKNFKKYDSILQLHEKDYSYEFFQKNYGIKSLILENAAEDVFFDIEGIKKEKYIINVSNFCQRKNQLQCVKIFEKSNLPEEWKLVLVGSRKNSYFEEIKNYCETKLDSEMRDRVVLYVGISRDETIELVKKASVYIMTSLWEAFPISLLEGMAASVPFVSSDVGIVKYLEGGVVAHTIDEFAGELKKLTEDEMYRTNLGAEGREAAKQKYKISKKVDQLEEIINSLVQKVEK